MNIECWKQSKLREYLWFHFRASAFEAPRTKMNYRSIAAHMSNFFLCFVLHL